MSKKVMSPANRAMLAIQTPMTQPEPGTERQRKDKPFASAKTGPGGLSAAMMEVDERVAELSTRAEVAEKALQGWTGVLPTRLIDPSHIVHSAYANRLNDSFTGPEFEALKKEIRESGGNVQPIKVRPVPGANDRFEVVFGHRRHRACAENGLQVLAVVEALDDRKLFAEMDRENRLRADLKPYEQGLMYKRALERGLFPSQRKLADELGVDQSNVAKAVAVASLPTEVLCAFSSPLAIQFRWASPLRSAFETDPDRVVARAKEIAATSTRLQDPEVYLALADKQRGEAKEQQVVIAGKNGAVAIHKETPKAHIFEIKASDLSPERVQQIKALIAKLIG